MAQFIPLTSNDGFVLPAYVAEPEGQPRGAMVVILSLIHI